jgi:hypothetical protein
VCRIRAPAASWTDRVCCSVACAVLYDGQRELSGSTTATLDYVVGQADGAAATMRNFTALLEAAKTAGGGVASLPPDVARGVDDVARRVDAAADATAARAASNSRRIRTSLDAVYVRVPKSVAAGSDSSPRLACDLCMVLDALRAR